MRPVTRRSVLIGGSVGVASVASGGALRVAGAEVVAGSALRDVLAPETGPDLDDLSQSLLLQVRDARTGEVALLVEDREVVFTDHALVARLRRAAG